jgi:hypothetical protein
MIYDSKSVLSAWALMVFKFFHLVVILIFEDKILIYITPNICRKLTKAACDLLPRLSFSRSCITSGFP